MTFARAFEDHKSALDEQNRRDRLARIYRDARRAEREPEHSGNRVGLLVAGGLLLACLVANGCTDRTSNYYSTLAAPDTASVDSTRCHKHHHHDAVESGRLLVAGAPADPLNLSEEEERTVREMMDWFRGLSPQDRQDVKAYLAYMAAINGTGPWYCRDDPFGFGSWVTTDQGTTHYGELR